MKGIKTGGRQKGSLNKDNPIRGYLLSHSISYFQPNEQNPDGISDFEVDLSMMLPEDRVAAEIKILKHHTSELRSVDMDMSVNDRTQTIDERLTSLAGEDDD